MLLLAIETSCDETAMAVIETDLAGVESIKAEVLSSQIKLHQAYGGVVPELAAREHLKNLPILYDLVLQQANINSQHVSAICVTQGPGLKGCLLMGSCFAEGLGLALNVPVYAINHIEAHVLAPFIENHELQCPYLALVVSGGHTEIVLVNNIGNYTILSRTTDDAAGEAFDKSANLLGIKYPGGAELAKLADTVTSSSFTLPKVMAASSDFSFSGLKTAISLLIKKQSALTDSILAELSYAIQFAIISTLAEKLQKAIKATGIERVAVTGGVAANRALRAKLSELTNSVYFPSTKYCTDNAVMVGYAHKLRMEHGILIKAQQTVMARWPLEELKSSLA